jgi:hypothetical protein
LSCLTCKLLFRTFQIYIYIHIYIYTQLHVLYTVTLHKYDICKYIYIYDIRMTYDFIY